MAERSKIKVSNWESKFAGGGFQSVGILFRGNPQDCDLEHRGKWWVVEGIKIPDAIVARRRCAYGVDFTACCDVHWRHPIRSRRGLAIRVLCATKQHRTVLIPQAIISEIIFPPRAE
jgi:hypothetical protein